MSVLGPLVEALASGRVEVVDLTAALHEDTPILVLPDPLEAVTHLWAEGTDGDSAQALLDEWAVTVEQAGR